MGSVAGRFGFEVWVAVTSSSYFLEMPFPALTLFGGKTFVRL